MYQYEVKLPENLTLLVEVDKTPVHFSIQFPGGDEVKFSYIPERKPRGKVELSSALQKQELPVTTASPKKRLRVSPLGVRGVAIEFADPEGTLM